jgi:hypothetical protein
MMQWHGCQVASGPGRSRATCLQKAVWGGLAKFTRDRRRDRHPRAGPPPTRSLRCDLACVGRRAQPAARPGPMPVTVTIVTTVQLGRVAAGRAQGQVAMSLSGPTPNMPHWHTVASLRLRPESPGRQCTDSDTSGPSRVGPPAQEAVAAGGPDRRADSELQAHTSRSVAARPPERRF